MSCKHWKEEWVARLYGELEPAEERALTSHLEGCADCRDTLEVLASSRKLLQDCAPAVPLAPRVVVLHSKRPWNTPWAFAAGAAFALVLFSLGYLAAQRWPGAVGPSEAGMARVDDASAGRVAIAGQFSPQGLERLEALQASVSGFEQRVADLERNPDPSAAVSGEPLLTQGRLEQEIRRLERRIDSQRARDLEYLLRSMTASEIRTGTWMDQTQEALQLLALRQDPRIRER